VQHARERAADRVADALPQLGAQRAGRLLGHRQRVDGGAVLLVGYDGFASGPLSRVSRSEGVLGASLVLSRSTQAGLPQLRISLGDGDAGPGDGALARRDQANAMAPMLPLFDALASGGALAMLKAGPGRVLRVEIDHG
jgi:hypothetical protein